ncbi:putative transcription factor Hap3/NF-YB family [Rosa chinensis]|uniref:Putative transcription factor Hap3/NF-YB family n=1 Tax=Rosa chinensis TaxID=74649 RepID=A0A2P6QY85_ROSCH|nr:nuclear transcription factor Y subunit B-4 [Rosa chinensis]PRQ39134.1 putative transcription factor Hap3/NF-YB family [Rosa chinensis]
MVDNIGGSAPNICDHGQGDIKTEQPDQLLPIANVGRIMKQILPPNAKISKEAKETMQECVSEFISFVTGEASHKCQKEKRKTVNGDDICWALATLGFDNYAGPLRRYLHRYRDQEGAEHIANDNNNNEDKLKLLVNNILSTDQEQRIIMIMNQYDHPHHDIQKT